MNHDILCDTLYLHGVSFPVKVAYAIEWKQRQDYADRRGLLLEFIGNRSGLNITAIDILLRWKLFL